MTDYTVLDQNKSLQFKFMFTVNILYNSVCMCTIFTTVCFHIFCHAYSIYTIYTKVCGHPFKLVDSSISATLVADRCIQLSTQPCNLHKQTLALEWPYCHLSNKSVHQISALPWSTVSAVIVMWKHLGATLAQPRSGRPHKLTEQDR